MRIIKYKRHYPSYAEDHEAILSTFVYDVPYLDGCDIFPPFHILNQILREGGCIGGMGPGATWEPFEITEEEYSELWAVLDKLDPESIGDKYLLNKSTKYSLDNSFDQIKDQWEWREAVCAKHRDAYLRDIYEREVKPHMTREMRQKRQRLMKDNKSNGKTRT